VATGIQLTAELVGALVEGATPEGALNVAKILRMAGRRLGLDLWPSPGSGKRAADFTAGHLTNLLLALACGVPTQAVETVQRFSTIPRAGPPREHWQESQEFAHDANILQGPEIYASAPLRTTTTVVTRDRDDLLAKSPDFFPDTLGQLFDHFVTQWADPGTSEATRTVLRKATVLVALGRRPWAEYVQSGIPGADGLLYLRYAEADLPSAELAAPTTRRQVVFDGALFERLGAIWVGTLVAAPSPIILTTGGQALSADETAASLAGEAAALGDPPAMADGCPSQVHPIGEREKPQPPSVSRIGHLPPDNWRVSDEGRKGAALGAGT
jgi:hypothetical protein